MFPRSRVAFKRHNFHCKQRLFTSSPETPKHAPKSHTSAGEFASLSKKSAAIFGASSIALLGYFYYTKEQLKVEKEKRSNESIGKPLVGGPFKMVTHFGQPVTEKSFFGKYTLLYFGYTFCPDVCPEELDKMSDIVNRLEKEGFEDEVVPIFVSCDPKRDSIKAIKEYLKEFHPKFIGLTGTHSQIKSMAKAYRLYFSAPPRALDDDDADYLVDHSIFFYLMGPDGEFVDHFGRNLTAAEVSTKIQDHINARKQK